MSYGKSKLLPDGPRKDAVTAGLKAIMEDEDLSLKQLALALRNNPGFETVDPSTLYRWLKHPQERAEEALRYLKETAESRRRPKLSLFPVPPLDELEAIYVELGVLRARLGRAISDHKIGLFGFDATLTERESDQE